MQIVSNSVKQAYKFNFATLIETKLERTYQEEGKGKKEMSSYMVAGH